MDSTLVQIIQALVNSQMDIQRLQERIKELETELLAVKPANEPVKLHEVK